jgi:hypothetical protein
MRKNIGTLDRVIRFIIAVILVALYSANIVTGVWGIVLLVVAGISLITGLTSFCGLYTLLGISTRKIKK